MKNQIVPSQNSKIIREINFKRFTQILEVVCTAENHIFPISIKDGKISQNITAEKVCMDLEFPDHKTNKISFEFILEKEKIKDLSALANSDVTIKVKDGIVSFQNFHTWVNFDHCLPQLKSPPNLTEAMRVGSKVKIPDAKSLKRYLGKSRNFLFLIYQGQLEAVKTLNNPPFFLTSLNQDLLEVRPERVLSSSIFPVLLDTSDVYLSIYQRSEETWLVCSHENKFDLQFKTYILLEE